MTVVNNPLFARYFTRVSARNEQRGNRELRRDLVAGLTGDVLEVGPGTGLNFPHYAPGVHLTGVEPEPYLRARATERADTVRADARVVAGTADRLPADDESQDALVVSGLLCSVPDPAAALAEFERVLKPGGQLRFYEHVRSRDPLFGAYQTAVKPLHMRLMGGCDPARDTLRAIESVFTLDAVRAFRFPMGETVAFHPVAPRILGTAHKKG